MDFTKSDRDNFHKRKMRVIHDGIKKGKIMRITKQENRRKAEFYLQYFPALVPEKVNAVRIKRLLGSKIPC